MMRQVVVLATGRRVGADPRRMRHTAYLTVCNARRTHEQVAAL